MNQRDKKIQDVPKMKSQVIVDFGDDFGSLVKIEVKSEVLDEDQDKQAEELQVPVVR